VDETADSASAAAKLAESTLATAAKINRGSIKILL